MTTIREFAGGVPERIKVLPLDERGYPIPKFVEWIDGKPDFRIMSAKHLQACIRQNRCWICGEPMGVHKVFVIGPMCCVNRVSAEPPSHFECARFAALNCPFLSKPLAKRRDTSDVNGWSAGFMIERNPGVSALWFTRRYRPFKDGDGVLFDIGEAERVEFYSHGRRARIEEIRESVTTGLPFLENAARSEGSAALKELDRQLQRFEKLLERVLT